MHMIVKTGVRLALRLLLATAPSTAHAYMGPGVGMGALSVALGIIGSIILGLFSIIWYPLKRLIRRLRRRRGDRSDG